jgi:hypothetical protein
MEIYELYFSLSRTSVFFESLTDAKLAQGQTTASMGVAIHTIQVVPASQPPAHPAKDEA